MRCTGDHRPAAVNVERSYDQLNACIAGGGERLTLHETAPVIRQFERVLV